MRLRLRNGHRLTLVTLTCLSLLGSLPAIAAPSVQAGFSPEGSAEQLVLKTIETAQHNIRLMGYSFTSPEVVRALISAKRRGVDVKVVLDEKGNRGKASVAAMNLLVNAAFLCVPSVNLKFCTIKLLFWIKTLWKQVVIISAGLRTVRIRRTCLSSGGTQS